MGLPREQARWEQSVGPTWFPHLAYIPPKKHFHLHPVTLASPELPLEQLPPSFGA